MQIAGNRRLRLRNNTSGSSLLSATRKEHKNTNTPDPDGAISTSLEPKVRACTTLQNILSCPGRKWVISDNRALTELLRDWAS